MFKHTLLLQRRLVQGSSNRRRTGGIGEPETENQEATAHTWTIKTKTRQSGAS